MKPIMTNLKMHQQAVAVVGLGYVGLPLACLLATKYRVFGFDINERRVFELQDGIDRTSEVTIKDNLRNPNLQFSSDPTPLAQCSIIIVAVPTPIDNHKKPDLRPLIGASETIGRHLAPGTIVVYESTVYPGLTEDICRIALERTSGLKFGVDFHLGYSPERINPGDKVHTVDKVVKIVSGSSPEVLDVVDQLYSSVIPAGTHRAPSIATAEAAKIIENAQRDINIALINELAVVFEKIGLDTLDVVEAAGSKWNFMAVKPGLVGGHCIGVDPYYLTYLAESLNIHPQVISSGRKINDAMGKFVGEKMMRLLLASGQIEQPLSVVICGMTFKENVPDLRNSKVLDLIHTLEDYGTTIYCHDPHCDPDEFHEEFGRHLTAWEDLPSCAGVVVAVPHEHYRQGGTLEYFSSKLTGPRVLIDLRGLYDRQAAKDLNMKFWRL